MKTALLSAALLALSGPKPYAEIIRTTAARHNLPADLVAGVIMQESSGRWWVSRYELGFFRRYIKGRALRWLKSKDQREREVEEQWCSTSIGLMQVMGCTARELGYTGARPMLYHPAVNIEFGCRKLAKELNRTGSVQAALQAYNGGSDPTYHKRVLARISSGQIKKLI